MIDLFNDSSSDDDEQFARQLHQHRTHDHPHHNQALVPMRRLLAPRRQLPALPTPPLSLDWMHLEPYGFPETVALSELPGSKFRGRHRDLATDIATIQSLDIGDVVVLLTVAELRKFRVPHLLTEYEASGFLVFHYPIEDGMVPSDVLSFNALVDKIRKRIADGNRVLIHCYGGLGRAVLVAACLMLAIDSEVAPEQVIGQMRALRGPRAVQSVKQYNFINDYRDLTIRAQHGSDDDDDGFVSR